MFLVFLSIKRTFGLAVIAANNQPKLLSIDETVVYRALTVIEGDILVDKFCECKPQRDCRRKQSIIKLTK